MLLVLPADQAAITSKGWGLLSYPAHLRIWIARWFIDCRTYPMVANQLT